MTCFITSHLGEVSGDKFMTFCESLRLYCKCLHFIELPPEDMTHDVMLTSLDHIEEFERRYSALIAIPRFKKTAFVHDTQHTFVGQVEKVIQS